MRVWMCECGILYGTYGYLEIIVLKLFANRMWAYNDTPCHSFPDVKKFRRNVLPTDSDKQVSHRSSGSDGDSDMACTRDF